MRALLILTLSVTLLCGCSSIGKVQDVVAWVSEKHGEMKATIQEQDDKLTAMADRVVAVHGSLDTNGNGEIDADEKMAVIKDTVARAAAGDPDAKDWLKSWEFWVLVLGGGPTVLGMGSVARKKLLNPSPPPAA